MWDTLVVRVCKYVVQVSTVVNPTWGLELDFVIVLRGGAEHTLSSEWRCYQSHIPDNMSGRFADYIEF